MWYWIAGISGGMLGAVIGYFAGVLMCVNKDGVPHQHHCSSK